MRCVRALFCLSLACAPAAPVVVDAGLPDSGTPAIDGGGPDAGGLDGGRPDAGARLLCDAGVGLAAPASVCTPTNPCLAPGALQQSQGPLTTSLVEPVCRTTVADGHPAFDDGPPRRLMDREGLLRPVCAFTVPGSSASSKRPLVVFFHGLGGTAATPYNATLLRQKAETFALSGDASRPGFHLISVQGRNLHFPGGVLGDGSSFDFFHRALGAPSTNADIDLVDRLIDARVADGDVDEKRLYVVGWSSGGYFAQLYALARSVTPTAAGHRVAAAFAYSAADPFERFGASGDDACRVEPPRSTVPLLLVSRACDIVACSEEQYRRFEQESRSLGPFMNLPAWQARLAGAVRNPNVTRRIVLGTGVESPACTVASVCSWSTAVVNHLRWIDGVADQGVDHEPAALAFLSGHPLP